MTESLYVVIMAGGGGTRLWPLSRSGHPKQMLKLFGERTMFQLSVDRLLPLLPPAHICVVTAAEQVDPLAAQYPDLPRANFIVEPLGRGTAACIGLAAMALRQRDPNAVMAVVTADHLIRRVDTFRAVLRAAQQVAEQGYLVTLGITPTFAATGYGYIRRGTLLGQADGFDYYRVERFTEKPDAPTAAAFLEEGVYSWNSGMFIWRTDRILEEIRRWMPDLSATLEALQAVWDTPAYAETLARLWPPLRKETIDYGIMEKADRVAVIPVDLEWSDIGAWPAVMDAYPHDAAGNVLLGDVIGIDNVNTLVFAQGERLVATIGVQDLIVVDTPDAVLITRRDQAERVKEVIGRLQAAGRHTYL
ncbi:MAG TPA: mannose-1-phosphate guanylyltransferase [Anaerolineae bacterium]|mgnify:CR=1 FL=1|nr:mannose-1-phosphate guanylyltransferase [Anaerolineae bacterium]HQK13297.1 mannose-1-phosphate guanylyltransferase [Anaerolineae bacterium]